MRPSYGADGRCPNCKTVVVNTSKQFATCPKGDMRLIPAFHPSFLLRVASDLPTATRLPEKLKGTFFTYRIDGHPGRWRRWRKGDVGGWEVFISPVQGNDRWVERRFIQIVEINGE